MIERTPQEVIPEGFFMLGLVLPRVAVVAATLAFLGQVSGVRLVGIQLFMNQKSAIRDEKIAGIRKTEIRILLMNLVLANSSYNDLSIESR
jgi:hypothetical protein